MNSIRTAGASLALLAALAALSGCATEGPTATGASVRALMASQVIPPQPRAAGQAGTQASDGASAVAAYANYKQSYVVPQPQGDSPLVGGRK
jgi:hypothetical protein